MKTMFSKLLPLVFLAMLSLAPVNAQAAGPTTGMFDCLGDLDWGCKVIGFLFETTDRGNDNSVTYVKDGTTYTEQPTVLMAALRAMMQFFSNALLIVASIKLLYELIQMTAESAQTGKVGGKDTNQLWAPIRLVIAIGLLVPLDTGLNSAQYIVLQIAKWGSGMASQGWKVFVAKLSTGESMTVATAPRIRNLAINTFKTYACMELVNYYAKKLSLDENVITREEKPNKDYSSQAYFGNKIHDNVCGNIRYNLAAVSAGNKKEDARISLELSKGNYTDFIQTEYDLAIEGSSWAKQFEPEGRKYGKPSDKSLKDVIQAFQDKLTERIEGTGKVSGLSGSAKNYAKNAMTAITDQIQSAANTQGWTSAGSWFLAITRAQGQIINGAANIPDASGPNMKVFESYPSAYADYLELEEHLGEGKRDNKSLPTGSTSAGFSEVDSDIERGWLDKPADWLFSVLDWMARRTGLWDSDPKKAFGDLGGSSNPFAEIAALGHKKIQLALRYVGLAAGSSILGVVGNIGARQFALKEDSSSPPIARQALAGLGGLASGATALLMMFATLFFLAGVLLAYVVPLFPFTRFFFSILTWLGSLIEAMVLVPFMALAFLTPKGEGFAGPNTKNAFFLIFQLFLRPILCIFGLMGALLLFYVAAKFLNASFYEATSGIGDYQGTAMRFMQKLVFSVMYVGLIYSAANISFKMIEHFPKHALKWMGGSASEESYDDHNSVTSVAAAVGGQALLGQISSLPQNLISPLSQAYGQVKEQHDAAIGKHRHHQLEASQHATERSTRAGDAFSSPVKPSTRNGTASPMVQGGALESAPSDAGEAIQYQAAMSAVHDDTATYPTASGGTVTSAGLNDADQSRSVGQAVRAQLRSQPGQILGAINVGKAISAVNASQGAITTATKQAAVENAVRSHLNATPADLTGAIAAGETAHLRTP